MRVRDFGDPADEDYERILDEQRERDERADRFAEKGPAPLTDECQHLPRFTASTPEGVYECAYCGVEMRPVLSRHQED